MSFSENVKEELAHLSIENCAEARAEFFGFVKSRGALRIRSNKTFLVIPLGSISSLKRLYLLSKFLDLSLFETQVKETQRFKHVRGGEIVYRFADVEKLLSTAKISITGDSLPPLVRKDPVYFGAFVRGLFLAGGSIVDPSKSYHLEIILDTTNEFVERLKFHLWSAFNIKSGVVTVRNHFKLYIKSSRDIIELLSLMGAFRVVAVLQKAVEVRQIRSDVSRTLNFLTANANKSGQAMARQVKAIRLIEEKIGLDRLPEDLRKIAELRLEYEDLSLRELGELMDPPMSKSAVYNRFKKIIKIAESLGGLDEMPVL